ncbi:MAG: DNA repair protein RecN [Candidatus Binatia bacterium]|jgi:DNA repair protein RecN (Recombination protein N)|nr:DNA repair protein RecN [Candidatus Binatia bacterium]
MLRELSIKNFAVIDHVTFDLGAGLNVLSGETGAGKTIILNALSLILGGRTSSDIIRHEEEEATVEALFESLPKELRDKLKESGFGDEEELVIKRVISRSGKNRAYCNGSLCPLTLLAEIDSHLIHIYGQHEHHSLLRPESHLAHLDAFAGLEDRAGEMKRRYQSFASAWDQLRQAKETLQRRRREEEFLRAQSEEISRASLRIGEEEELEARKKILNHAEKLFQGCKEAEEGLYEGEDALVSRLGKYVPRLRELAAIDRALADTVELLNSSLAQMEEAASSLRRYSERIEFNPQSLEQLEDRLAEIHRLKRKYGGSEEDILRVQEKVEEDLAALGRGEEEIDALEEEFDRAKGSALELAEALSRERTKSAKGLRKAIEKEVEQLGMPHTTFELRFFSDEMDGKESPLSAGGKRITESGLDQVEFYFSPNPGETVKPLAKIASGGEISRVMLALKSLVFTKGHIPTLLFDEVDAGIGGRVAEMVGRKMKKVSQAHQVLCVTHLPQIAALAGSHYVVEKEVAKGRTFTKVQKLNAKERVREVARMLGGVKITPQATRHAKEMINSAGD